MNENDDSRCADRFNKDGTDHESDHYTALLKNSTSSNKHNSSDIENALCSPVYSYSIDKSTVNSQPTVPLTQKISLEPVTESQNDFLCTFCNKKYHHRQSLQRHINKTHPTEKRNTCFKIKCQEESCNFSCRYLHQLREHLTTLHNLKFNLETKTFNSYTGN